MREVPFWLLLAAFWLLIAASCVVSGILGWRIRALVDAHRARDRYDLPEDVDG